MREPYPYPDALRAQVDRICRSSGFAREESLRRLLRYLVDESQAGRVESLREHAIGVEVFDRGDEFDPHIDPIVRVEASRLHAKLVGYYASEGARDAIRIEVPPGGYDAPIPAPAASAAAAARDPVDGSGAADASDTDASDADANDADANDAYDASAADARPARPARSRSRHWHPVPVGIGVALLLAAGLGFWRMRARNPPPSSSPAASHAPASIAVLPLTPIGDDPSLAVFSDGLTEEIVTELARLPGLRVIARASVRRLKQAEAPIREIARDLQVETVLEGSVRRERGFFRVNAQLIDGRNEERLWTQPYDRLHANTLAIPGDVARETARGLAVQLTAREGRRMASPGASNPAAHEAYLRGVHHIGLRTAADVQRGVGWLEKAVSLDARYGAARAALAEACVFLALDGAGSPTQLMQRTRELAKQALATDPELAEGHRALGLVHALFDRDWPAAEQELRLALQLGPGMIASHEALATALLLPLGRVKEALAQQREAQARSPLDASAVATLGVVEDMAGNETEAVRLLESAIELEPRYARAREELGRLHLRHERPADALPLLQKAAELAPETTSVLGALAVAYARLGKKDDAEAVERQLDSRSRAGRAPAIWRAQVAMALGQADAAIRWLGQAVDDHEPWVIYLAVDAFYQPLRTDPRFTELLRRLGLSSPGA